MNCKMTMSDNGKNNVDGCEHFWECGKPAVAVLLDDRLRPNLPLCNLHRNVVNRRREKRGQPPAKWRILK